MPQIVLGQSPSVAIPQGIAQSSIFGESPSVGVPTGIGQVSLFGVSLSVAVTAGVSQVSEFGDVIVVVSEPQLVIPDGISQLFALGDSPSVGIPSGIGQTLSFGESPAVGVPGGVGGGLSFGVSPTVGVPAGVGKAPAFGNVLVVPYELPRETATQLAGRGISAETNLILEIWREIEARRARQLIKLKKAEKEISVLKSRQTRARSDPSPSIDESRKIASQLRSLQERVNGILKVLDDLEAQARDRADLRAIGDEIRDLSDTMAKRRIQEHLDRLRQDDEDAIMMLM